MPKKTSAPPPEIHLADIVPMDAALTARKTVAACIKIKLESQIGVDKRYADEAMLREVVRKAMGAVGFDESKLLNFPDTKPPYNERQIILIAALLGMKEGEMAQLKALAIEENRIIFYQREPHKEKLPDYDEVVFDINAVIAKERPPVPTMAQPSPIPPAPGLPPIREATSAADAVERAEAAMQQKDCNRGEIAFELFMFLFSPLHISGLEMGRRIENAISDSTMNYWIRREKFEPETLLCVVDRISTVLLPDDTELAKRTANIMMELPWSVAKSYRERMQYAIEHKQSAREFMDMFRYQEREKIAAAWRQNHSEPSAKYEPVLAFIEYAAQGLPPDMAFTRHQWQSFKRRQDVPNTPLINHIARRMGAVTPEDFADFRKIVFEYPLYEKPEDVQKETRETFVALEAVGKDKVKRKAAFKQLEQALVRRDGLRPKGFRDELGQAIYDHARRHDAASDAEHKLIPSEGMVTPESLKMAWANLTNGGGETTEIRANMIAAYIFPDDAAMAERCKNAFAPNRLAERPGGNKFREGEKPFRPNWSHEGSMMAWSERRKPQGSTDIE